MKSTSFLAFGLPLFLSLFACASPDHPTAEEQRAGAQSEELSSRPPSRECGAVAKAAVRAVEAVNENAMRITRTELADGFSDRELVRVSIKRGASERDSYMISTESMGGSPCYVYGLQIKSQQTDLTSDNGQVINPNGPSQECGDVATKAVQAIAQVNGNRITVTGTELADGFSDRELVRVKVKLGDGSADSYLVNTESMGGSPCYVYGLQVKSQEGISTEDN